MDKSGLGRGLGSLIPNLSQKNQDLIGVSSDLDSEKIIKVPLTQIERNPLQPRENFNHSEMEDLIESIKKHGILQPLIVTQTAVGYQLIAGERRLRAAEVLELGKVPVIVRTAKDIEKLELSLIENLQRENLNPIEEAKAYQKLIDEFNLTQEEVAQRVGKKRATITNTLRLLDLPQEIQQALVERRLTTGHAKVILSEETNQARLKLFKKILNLTLTIREAEQEVKKVRVKSHERRLEKDLETLDKEDHLRKSLGTKVTINKKNGRGQIAIEFYSEEELNDLVERLLE